MGSQTGASVPECFTGGTRSPNSNDTLVSFTFNYWDPPMNSPDLPAGAKRAPAIRKPRAAVSASAARSKSSSRIASEAETSSETTQTAKRPATAAISTEERRRMVEVCAYFLAEQRGFAPGSDQQDWLEAEARVEAMLKRPARRTTTKRTTQ